MLRRERKTKEDFVCSLTESAVKTAVLCTVALLCVYSALWMAQDVFLHWALPPFAGVWLSGLVILTAAVCELGFCSRKRGRIGCLVFFSFLYGLILFRWAKERQIDLEDGACALATDYLEKFNKHVKMSVTIWQGKTEWIGMALAFGLLAAALFLLFLTLFTGRRVWLLLLPSAVLAAELLIGYTPQWNSVSLFFAALLFFHMGEDRGRKHTLRISIGQRRRQQTSSGQYVLPVLFLAGGIVLLLSAGGFLYDLTGSSLLEQAPRVIAFQRNTERNISGIIQTYFMQQRAVIGNQAPHYTGKEMFRVTASKKPAMDVLLKGFCGTEYENGSWVCDRQLFADACGRQKCGVKQAAAELLKNPYDVYTDVVERYESFGWFGDFGSVFNINNEEIAYTVEHTGMRSRFAYIPYAADYAQSREEDRLIGDLTVQKDRDKKIFTYHGWNQAFGHAVLNGMSGDSSNPVFRWYDEFAKDTYLHTSDRVPRMQEFAAAAEENSAANKKKEAGMYVSSPQLSVVYSDKFGGEPETDGRQLSSKGAYSVSGGQLNIVQILQEYQQAAEGYTDALSRNFMRITAASLIRACLQDSQKYSLQLDEISSEQDPVSYFLLKSHKGYCVHFASAAVLFLREFGVPARYATGYVARREDFKAAEDGSYTVSVKDSAAHAWVEIYLDQLGWIPFDVTPGEEMTAENDGKDQRQDSGSTGNTDKNGQDLDTQDQDQTQDQTDKQKDTHTKEADQEKRSGAYFGKAWFGKNDGTGMLIWFMVITAVLLLLFGVYQSGRFAVRMYRMAVERELREGHYNRAVSRMNRRIYRKLCIRGKIRRPDITDAEYERLLKHTDWQVADSDWHQFMQIIKKAAFAKEKLLEEEAYFCYSVYCAAALKK